MTWETIINKLTSRKLWVAIAGVATGIAIAFGGETGEISDVCGAVTAIVSAVSYIWAEASVDKAAITEVIVLDDKAKGVEE